MGKKKFFDKKKAATFHLLARDSSDPNYSNTPGSDRVFVRVDDNPLLVDTFVDNHIHHDDPNSIFADASHDDSVLNKFSSSSLPEHVRREILELGFPDDGYNYLIHLREIKNTGAGSAFYHNPKPRLDELPSDVKAFDASRVRVPELQAASSNHDSILSVASKTVDFKAKKSFDPDVLQLLDDSDLSRFGSDVEDLEEDFVVRANLPEEGEDVEIKEPYHLTDKYNFIHEFSDTCVSSVDQEKMVGYDAIGKMGNTAAGERDEFSAKPRPSRLLDEQFDVLERQEYGTDEEDYSYVAEEDEYLAERLKNSLHGSSIDNVEVGDKYEGPADVLHGNQKPKSKELIDSAADIIRRCAEYAEKYGNGEEDEVVVIQESSDESEKWDCETIVSTYSTLDNHPAKIEAPQNGRKKWSETANGASNSSSHMIALRGKEKLPVDFLPRSRKPATEKVKGVPLPELKNEPQKGKQHRQESKEEKKERKAAIKGEKREARRIKKEMKGLYRGETQRAQRVAAIAGPSSIHIM
ncbi:hypothetical protein K2173_018631 [Erythroxylum novogranatense]|uniref:Low temperature viability protein n=1 Tax=Erythroxylum novogranatense TaxID=1862640 RepID=A0AAV8SAW1_9ROSI|nr:hypothetical protein K2173_018631 [Erythroxylum novogranatense]